MSNENKVVLPEPDAWLAVYEDREGNSKFYTSTHKELAEENDTNGKPQPLYTEQQVRTMLATATGLPAQADGFGSAEHWKEKAQYWAGVAHRLRQEALRGEPVDGIIAPQAQASGVANE